MRSVGLVKKRIILCSILNLVEQTSFSLTGSDSRRQMPAPVLLWKADLFVDQHERDCLVLLTVIYIPVLEP